MLVILECKNMGKSYVPNS